MILDLFRGCESVSEMILHLVHRYRTSTFSYEQRKVIRIDTFWHIEVSVRIMTAETMTCKSSSANKMPSHCEIFGFIQCSSFDTLFVWTGKLNFVYSAQEKYCLPNKLHISCNRYPFVLKNLKCMKYYFSSYSKLICLLCK